MSRFLRVFLYATVPALVLLTLITLGQCDPLAATILNGVLGGIGFLLAMLFFYLFPLGGCLLLLFFTLAFDRRRDVRRTDWLLFFLPLAVLPFLIVPGIASGYKDYGNFWSEPFLLGFLNGLGTLVYVWLRPRFETPRSDRVAFCLSILLTVTVFFLTGKVEVFD